MNYAQAFRALSGQNNPTDKIDVIDEIQGPVFDTRAFPNFVENVENVIGGKTSVTPGSRVVSPPNTPWAELMDYERSRAMTRRGIPEHLAKAVGGLWSRSIPDLLKTQPTRWQQLLLDAESLVAETPSGSLFTDLLAKKWTLVDVFGVNPKRSHAAGLCWQMHGSTVSKILPENALLGDGRRIAKPTDNTGREFIWRLWS